MGSWPETLKRYAENQLESTLIKIEELERSTQMMCQPHYGMTAHVTHNRVVSEAFALINGMISGCVLVCTIFSLMFSAMQMDVCREERSGTCVAYRTHGPLFNRRWMNFHSSVFTTSVHKLPFPNDCALNAISEGDMQRGMYLFAATCNNFDLIINTEKTVVMH
nr:unnamed protein product [Spirometra erinaceieuropaei]